VILDNDYRSSWGDWYCRGTGEMEILARLTKAKAFRKDVFNDQERKSWDRRGLDTLVVMTVNDPD